MASKIVVDLDTSKSNFLMTKCKQNDDLILECNIFENGLALDLTNKEISIQALKADKTYIIQNTDITKENNKFTANLVRDFTRVPGTTKIEIVLVESSKQNTTFSFCLEVVGSVIRGAVESPNTVTILENLQEKILEAGAVKEETEQLIEKGGAATKGEIQEVNAQLEQTTQQLNTSLEFGEIKFPSDFIKVPFKFYRDFDSKIKHNVDFNKYKKGTKVYVDFSALASEADGSETKPYKTLKTAIKNIATGTDDSYTIICKSYRFDRNSCPEAFTLTNKNISIIPYDNSSNIIMTNHSTGLIWENEEGIWKTTRSSVCEVFDLRNTDVYNLPVPLTHSETLSTCKSTQNTWFTDGVSVWINTIDGLKPTDEYFVIGTGQGVIQPKLINSTLYLENCRILANNQATYSKFDGDINSSLILNNVTSIGGNSRPNAIQQSNGFNITNFGLTALFNCKSAYCGLDGFNYHFQNISTEDRRKCLVVEYNCLSYKCGLLDSSATSDNGTTAHEGINILRIGTIAYETNGPVLADVNDCYSICIDCNIRDSISTNPSFCDNYKFAGIGDGKAVLINCGSSGNVAYDLNSNILTYLKKFKGNKIKFKDKIDYI